MGYPVAMRTAQSARLVCGAGSRSSARLMGHLPVGMIEALWGKVEGKRVFLVSILQLLRFDLDRTLCGKHHTWPIRSPEAGAEPEPGSAVTVTVPNPESAHMGIIQKPAAAWHPLAVRS